MNILHVSCSPRGQASESFGLAQKIICHLRGSAPTATVTARSLCGGVLPHVDDNYAKALGASGHRVDELFQGGSLLQSEVLIRELESADVLVIGTPMHNLTVPSALKAWIDHVVRVRRTFNVGADGKKGLLRDRPVFVAVASGGRFSGEQPSQPDFLTPYLRTILGTIGLHDVTFFSIQGTALGSATLAAARTGTDVTLRAHFSSTRLAAISAPAGS
jgi:FMN-dependent NADH-azoreductase